MLKMISSTTGTVRAARGMVCVGAYCQVRVRMARTCTHPVIQVRVAEVQDRYGHVQASRQRRDQRRLTGAGRAVEQVPAPPRDAVRRCNHAARFRKYILDMVMTNLTSSNMTMCTNCSMG